MRSRFCCRFFSSSSATFFASCSASYFFQYSTASGQSHLDTKGCQIIMVSPKATPRRGFSLPQNWHISGGGGGDLKLSPASRASSGVYPKLLLFEASRRLEASGVELIISDMCVTSVTASISFFFFLESAYYPI